MKGIIDTNGKNSTINKLIELKIDKYTKKANDNHFISQKLSFIFLSIISLFLVILNAGDLSNGGAATAVS